MKIKSGLKLAASVAIVSAVFASSMVSAQSGSRLCGFTADLPPGFVLNGTPLPAGGKIGLLYECRDGDASYHRQCDEAINKFRSAYQGDAALKNLNWVERKRMKCEDVGVDFTSDAQPSTDMCDQMEAKTGYSVIKPYNSAKKTALKTTYSKAS